MNQMLKNMYETFESQQDDPQSQEILSTIKRVISTTEFKLFSSNVQDFYTYFLFIHLQIPSSSSSPLSPSEQTKQENYEKQKLTQFILTLGFSQKDAETFIKALDPYALKHLNILLGEKNPALWDIKLNFCDLVPLNEAFTDLYLYIAPEDLSFLESLISKDKDRWNSDLIKLLISFICFARANPHPNGWIKYDSKSKDYIFYLASCQKKDAKYKEYLTSTLHSVYNLDMRVVGSTQPIPCFKLKWQQQPQSLICLGRATPDTINTFYDTLIQKVSS